MEEIAATVKRVRNSTGTHGELSRRGFYSSGALGIALTWYRSIEGFGQVYQEGVLEKSYDRRNG
jgi:hypothetical protein